MTKNEKISLVVIVILVIVVLYLIWYILNLWFTTPSTKPRFSAEKEIARVVSPDSLVDAIVTEVDPSHPLHTIYVVPHGRKHTEEDESVFFADYVDSLDLIWKMPKLLGIKYSNARLWHFKNYWYSADVQYFSYAVEVRLLPPGDRSSLEGKYPWDKWILEPGDDPRLKKQR
jgi:hypothetical protein